MSRIFGPMALFIGALLGMLTSCGPAGQSSHLANQPMPAFDLPAFDWRQPGLKNADLRQGKVTVVNLFASWCGPCRREAKHIVALAEKGAVVHGVAIADAPGDVAAYLAEYGNPYQRLSLDPTRTLTVAIGVQAVPQTFVIDGKGIIRAHIVGGLVEGHVDQLIDRIESLEGA